jgi:predicted nucleic acid-binding protein
VALILDTNALSAFVDGVPSIRTVIRGSGLDLSLPVVAYGEYLFGVRHSRLRVHYQQWLKENLTVLDLLPINSETASHYAEVRSELRQAGKPIPSNDVWIAALARQFDYPLLTRDRHFNAIRGVRVVTW